MKPLSFSVLRLLNHADFRSGEEIARQLGISRASVWQALRDLDRYGVRVFRIPGRGYRLADSVQWLEPDRIVGALCSKAGLLTLDVLDRAESSNTELLHRASQGAAHGTCLAVELQTGGRGRRGRTWLADLGGSLTFSVLWRFSQGAGYLSGLSLAVGVALMRALLQAGVTDARLKWPNDILHHGRKMAGILIELQGDMHGPSAAIIGIGLNLRLSEHTRSSVDQAATDLASTTTSLPHRNEILTLILDHLVEVLQQFEAQGFAGLRDEWSRHHAYQGQGVSMMMPDGSIQRGVVSGIADDGALLVRNDGGEKRFTAGEISMRGET